MDDEPHMPAGDADWDFTEPFSLIDVAIVVCALLGILASLAGLAVRLL